METQKFDTYADIRWQNRNTARQYKLLARRVEAFWEGDLITQKTILLFQKSLVGSKNPNNPLYYYFLKAYLKCYAADIEDSEQKIEVIRSTSRAQHVSKFKYLEQNELEYVIAECHSKLAKLIMRVLFETGLRVSELVSTTDDFINLQERTMTGVGKGNLPYCVKFSPKTAEWITKWMRICRDPHRPFTVFRQKDPTMPCVNQQRAVWQLLKDQGALMGFEDDDHLFPHRFRHTLGHSLRHDFKLDIMQVKEKLRHLSIMSTQIYSPATQEEVDALIDEKVFGVKKA